MDNTHIIFDLDGTLIDSRPEIKSAYEKVCKKIVPGRLVDFNEINYGQTLPSILKYIYDGDEEKMKLARKEFIELYDNSGFEDTVLYPSVEETLLKLHEANYSMHIATNKRLVPTLKIVTAKKIFPYFKGIITSDKTEGRIMSKQEMVNNLCVDFGIEKGYMVGDGDQDMEAGHLNNLSTVAALYGYEKKEILLKKNPKFVINQFIELTTILSKNI